METLALSAALKYVGGGVGLIIILLISHIVWLKFKMNKICEDILSLEKKVEEYRESTASSFKEYMRRESIDLKFTLLQDVLAAKSDTLLAEIKAMAKRVNGG